jgi:hypothetical protein
MKSVAFQSDSCHWRASPSLARRVPRLTGIGGEMRAELSGRLSQGIESSP